MLDAAKGQRLTRFKVPLRKPGSPSSCSVARHPVRSADGARVQFAFEATGHVWEAVSALLEQQGLSYSVVNSLATFRVREARQMSRDKRDVTDAEEIAQLLRCGVVTQCQLFPAGYMQLRRAWGAYHPLGPSGCASRHCCPISSTACFPRSSAHGRP